MQLYSKLSEDQLRKKLNFQSLFMMASAILITLVVLFGQIGNADDSEDKVVVIGLDAAGSGKAVAIPKSQFRKTISTALSSVQDSILPALNDDQNIQTTNNQKLSLRTIGVGVGISGQFGLGPLFNVTLSPRVRLIFTNSLNPVYPD